MRKSRFCVWPDVDGCTGAKMVALILGYALAKAKASLPLLATARTPAPLLPVAAAAPPPPPTADPVLPPLEAAPDPPPDAAAEPAPLAPLPLDPAMLRPDTPLDDVDDAVDEAVFRKEQQLKTPAENEISTFVDE